MSDLEIIVGLIVIYAIIVIPCLGMLKELKKESQRLEGDDNL